jgi:hypothetical protein
MARGKSLWEMLMAKLQGPVEFQYYNPLQARIGSSLTINELDLKDYNFFVKEIRDYRRTLGGQEYPFADYVLLARPLGGEDVWVRLRLVPVDDPDKVSGLTDHVLVLRLYDEFPYDESFYKVVTDTTRKFEVIEDGNVTEEYWRINDVTDAYQAQVSVIKDTNHDGTADPDEVEHVRLEYWDYWREIKDEAGQPLKQYLFIEKDEGNGWFQLWRGQVTDAQQVFVF